MASAPLPNRTGATTAGKLAPTESEGAASLPSGSYVPCGPSVHAETAPAGAGQDPSSEPVRGSQSNGRSIPDSGGAQRGEQWAMLWTMARAGVGDQCGHICACWNWDGIQPPWGGRGVLNQLHFGGSQNFGEACANPLCG